MINGLKICYFHDRVIVAPKKMCLEDKAEGRQQRKTKLDHKEAEIEKEVESGGLRSTGSQKTNGLLSRIDSSRGPSLGKVRQLLSWSLFIKCSKNLI